MSLRHFIVPALLALCLLFGGASTPSAARDGLASGYIANLFLQLIALPVIGWALLRRQAGQPLPARNLVVLAAAMVAVILLQLIALPPSVWTILPGRARVAEGFALLGLELPWLPLSLNSEASIAGLLWLLPAFAALLGIIRLGAYRGTLLAWTLVAVTILSVMLAALQLTGGADSPFYLYQVTNFGFGVGFFANSNHQATLLLCALPFAAAIYAARGRSRSVKGTSGLAVVLIGVALIVATGIAINGSLAGVGLGVAALAASILLLRYRKGPVPAWGPAVAGIALAAAAAFIFFGPTSGGALLPGAEVSIASRQDMIGVTAQAAGDYFPAGSGVGTFAGVYPLYENPAAIVSTRVNHAHSDVVEIILETGIAGGLLMLAFMIWWCRRSYALWIRDDQPDQYARAAVIASAAIIAHSVVDYPLRTAGISTLFAVCLALMAQPRPSTRARRRDEESEMPRHLGERPRHLSA